MASTNSLDQVVFVPPQFNVITLSAGRLVMSGSNGTPNGTYYVLASTNLLLPASQWTPVFTNQFDDNGNFNFTNGNCLGMPCVFYILQVP